MSTFYTEEDLKAVAVKPCHTASLAHNILAAPDAPSKRSQIGAILELEAYETKRIQQNVAVGQITDYDGFKEVLDKWISRKSNEATFGVLFDVLKKKGIDLGLATVEILQSKWEIDGKPIPKAIPKVIPVGWSKLEDFRPLPINNEDDGKDDGSDSDIDWTKCPPLEVKVKTDPKISLELMTDECYKMDSNPRGIALIINNEFADQFKATRNGSKYDYNSMGKLFEELGFDVKAARNVRSNDLEPTIDAFKKDFITKDTGCLVVVVMTHGSYGVLHMEDGKPVNMYKEIIYKFDHSKCQALENKPKLFIFNACRKFEEESDAARKMNISDVLISCATRPGKVAKRHPNRGSRYIYALTKVFMERSYDTGVLDMLQKLLPDELENMKLKPKIELKETEDVQQVPDTGCMGKFKTLFLNPPEKL